MKLEQPRIYTEGSLEARLCYLERYIFRLTTELQMALDALEQAQKYDKGGT